MKKIAFITLCLLLPAFALTQDKKTKLPNGYAKMIWGTLLSKTKDNISGKLLFTDDKTIIITKDGELKYHYGFFKEEQEPEGKLLYVTFSFPYLELDSVLKKYKEKYGEPTSEILKDKKGAIVWSDNQTLLVLWVDNYKNKSFTKSIIYLSKDLAKKVNNYNYQIFNKKEIELLKKLTP